MAKRKRYNQGGLEKLAFAIVRQAAEDYYVAVRRLGRSPDSLPARRKKEELEKFFRSRYFSALSGMNPELLMERLKQEAKSGTAGYTGGDCAAPL